MNSTHHSVTSVLRDGYVVFSDYLLLLILFVTRSETVARCYPNRMIF